MADDRCDLLFLAVLGRAARVRPMSDACCGTGQETGPGPSRLRDVAEIRAAALAGVALGVGLAATAADVGSLTTLAFAAALVVGWLHLRARGGARDAAGTPGRGTLMAIAAAGAVAGELGGAATLAFVSSTQGCCEPVAVEAKMAPR